MWVLAGIGKTAVASIEWKPELEIGVPELDAQHRHLIGLINRLESAIREGATDGITEEILSQLVNYVRFHFATEERFMAENSYVKTDQHADLHYWMIHKVAREVAQLKTERAITPINLLTFLRKWLVEHIQDEVADLRELARKVTVRH